MIEEEINHVEEAALWRRNATRVLFRGDARHALEYAHESIVHQILALTEQAALIEADLAKIDPDGAKLLNKERTQRILGTDDMPAPSAAEVSKEL